MEYIEELKTSQLYLENSLAEVPSSHVILGCLINKTYSQSKTMKKLYNLFTFAINLCNPVYICIYSILHYKIVIVLFK